MGLHHLGGWQIGIAAVNRIHHARSELLECRTRDVVHPHDGLAVVTALADACHKGYLTQQLHVQLLGEVFAAVTPENELLLIGM